MNTLIGIFLLTLLVIAAIAIVRTRNLFVAVMLMGIASLLIAANFFLLDAADVALTEAAIGAGISTVFFLGALALTSERERTSATKPLLSFFVVTVAALVVIYATFDKPPMGDPNAPVHQHVATWYLEKTPEYIDIPNVVTAVLASFRGYDTLGEVIVVLTAGIGILFLMSSVPSSKPQKMTYLGADVGLRHHLIPRVIGRLLVPFILLLGLYIQFHGEYGPGGGFQAGAIIAGAFILNALLEGEERALRVIPRHILLLLMVAGVSLYTLVGVAGMLLGGNFLDYSVLRTDPVAGQQMGILIIEVGVGATVTGVLLSIFHALVTRRV